jgi:hypothetical protein
MEDDKEADELWNSVIPPPKRDASRWGTHDTPDMPATHATHRELRVADVGSGSGGSGSGASSVSIEARVVPDTVSLWPSALELPDDRDAPNNPYLAEVPDSPAVSADKATFMEEGHVYALQDARGTYPKMILSGSKVYDYLATYEKIQEMDLRIRLEKTMDKLKQPKFGSGNANPELHASFRHMLLYHFGTFDSRHGFTAPLSYRERARRFQRISDREFVYFIHSSVFERVERWILGFDRTDRTDRIDKIDKIDKIEGQKETNEAQTTTPQEQFPFNLDLPTDEMDYLELLQCLMPIQKGSKYWETPQLKALVQPYLDRGSPSLTDPKLGLCYTLPSKYGTQLHHHLEQRILGMQIKEEICRMYPVQEKEDMEQIDAFMERFPPGFFRHVEYRVASYRHKICGSIDAIRVDDEGVWHVYDHKRSFLFEPGKRIVSDFYNVSGYPAKDKISKKFTLGADGVYNVQNRHLVRSDMVFHYMIQLATYRKLLQLNGQRVSNIVYLNMFHPTMDQFCLIRMRLGERCKGTSSPVELVEGIFRAREKHIQKYFAVKESGSEAGE